MKTKKITLRKLLNYIEKEIDICKKEHLIGERFITLREIKLKIKGQRK